MRRFFLCFFLLLGLWLLLPLFQIRTPDRFSAAHIGVDYTGSFFPQEDLETAQTILSSLAKQGTVLFDYLGQGSQTMAFISQDGKIVLKVPFAQDIRGPKIGGLSSLLALSPSYREKQLQRDRATKMRKINQWAQSYALSMAHLKEETGLLAFHLHPTQAQFPKCLLKDKYQQIHEIDLDRAIFVLQKKAESLQERFGRTQTSTSYWNAVKAMETLFDTHTQKGLSDFNPRFKGADYGFIAEKAIFLDPGRLSHSALVEKNPEPEKERMKHFFGTWLSRKFPPPRSDLK